MARRKKVIKTKTWEFKWEEYSDGSSTLTRTNDGFNLFELAGLAEIAQQELLQQFKGKLKPTRIVLNYTAST